MHGYHYSLAINAPFWRFFNGQATYWILVFLSLVIACMYQILILFGYPLLTLMLILRLHAPFKFVVVLWISGWHICSICEKAAHYMCYTCTYSLCKACTKKADYLCVRENKGFCTTCMRTIMLIENNDRGNKEMVGIILHLSMLNFSCNCLWFRAWLNSLEWAQA